LRLVLRFRGPFRRRTRPGAGLLPVSLRR
jgi:hypothetical protein